MANCIKVLSQELASKIAAGEVIERPASVVKELVENAIDAESTHISLHIKAGGTQIISVEDNGIGMNPEDAVLAIHRHATSKISDISDLDSLQTMGFRGEALPSIGAVSQLEITTREEGSLSGTRVVVQGGDVTEVGEIGRAVGTTVTVKHLFYNTPARRKFLRSASTELRHITRTITNCALAHPEIGFLLHHNERELFHWPRAANLKGRLQDVYGLQLLKEALPLDYKGDGIVLSGWIGKPESARSSRVHQFVFVNKRPIVSQLLYHAIFEGYQPQLQKGKFPLAVIILDMDMDRVDVNVHPTKREVRFADERSVHRALVSAIRSALGESQAAPRWIPPQARTDIRKEIAARFPFNEPAIQMDLQRKSHDQIIDKRERELTSIPPSKEKEEGRPEEKEPPHKVGTLADDKVLLWQLHKRYIMAQIKDGAVIIDQHAAHERVLYEMAKKSFEGQRVTGQQLLFPLTLELSFEELAIMAEALPLFQQLGFAIKLFGGNTVVIEAIPALLRSGTGEQAIKNILDDLIETGKTDKDIRERIAISFACKTAMKDGDTLSQEEMNNLIDTLFATQNPYSCPHGRPTFIRLPLNELDRKFQR